MGFFERFHQAVIANSANTIVKPPPAYYAESTVLPNNIEAEKESLTPEPEPE
jgi:hypothetical protein